MQFDLMLNPGRFAWAVNVSVEDDSVRIGALYLEPNVPDSNIRLESGNDVCDVVLPDEYLRQPNALRAWNVDLPLISQDQQL